MTQTSDAVAPENDVSGAASIVIDVAVTSTSTMTNDKIKKSLPSLVVHKESRVKRI